MNFINYQDGRPIYEQISEKYKILILKGILEPDEKMPSVRQLAMDLSTNPNTVQRAYSELERQGFLYSVKGKGNFVSPNPHLRDLKKKELQSNAGVSWATITKMSKGETVSTEVLMKICKYLQCDVGDIMEFIDADKSEDKTK